MSRNFRLNKQEIRRHVRAIEKEYEKQWKRRGPHLPLQVETEAGDWKAGASMVHPNQPDPYGRRARVRGAFLRWFAHHDSDHPGWESFLREVEDVDGVPVAEEERDEAVQRLVDDGLLGGPRIEEQSWPILLELTPDGRRCVQDFDGDTVAWATQYRRGGSIYNDYRDQRVYAEGASGQISAHSPGSHQEYSNANVDLRRLRSAARFLVANIDDLDEEGFDVDDKEVLRNQAAELADEADKSEPSQGRLRQLAEKINTALLAHPLAAGVASGGTSGTASALLTAALAPPHA